MKICDFRTALFRLPVEWQQLDAQVLAIMAQPDGTLLATHPECKPMRYREGKWVVVELVRFL